MHQRGRTSIILYACALHITWGTLLFVVQEPITIVGTASLRTIVPWLNVRAVIYLMAGAGSLYAYLGNGGKPGGWRLGAMLLQQSLLMMSALDALRCVWAGQYADGYIATWWFILADQAPAILGACFHTGALVDAYRARKD